MAKRKKKPIESEEDKGGDEGMDLSSPMDESSQTEPEQVTEPDPVEDKPKEKPKPLRPSGVSFQVFAMVGGIKIDQLAGFENFVKRKDMGPMSVKAWHVEYEKFLHLPA